MRISADPTPLEMRRARQLALLTWLSAGRHGSAAEVAGALGVTTRTVYRYRRIVELARSYERDMRLTVERGE